MSELKERMLGQTMNEFGCDTKIYLKSEADKVIAELKERLDTTEKLLNKALNGVSNGNKHMMSLARKKNHADYKRCLAMAKWCFTKSNYHYILARHGEDSKKNNRKSILYSRWRNRWLAIAEKFNEAK